MGPECKLESLSEVFIQRIIALARKYTLLLL